MNEETNRTRKKNKRISLDICQNLETLLYPNSWIGLSHLIQEKMNKCI